MTITFETKAKTQGVLVQVEAEIGQAIDYIIGQKGCTRDEFIKESIYRNINYFMQHEGKNEEVSEFVQPEIIKEQPKPKRKRRSRKK